MSNGVRMTCKCRIRFLLSILGSLVFVHNFWNDPGLTPVLSPQNAETHETMAVTTHTQGALAAVEVKQERTKVIETNESIRISSFLQSAPENENTAPGVARTRINLQHQQQEQHNDESVVHVQRQRPTPTTFDCIVFFHIPKAGGSSFNMFLNKVQETMGWDMPNWGTYWFQHHTTPPSKLAASDKDKDLFMAYETVIHRGHLTPAFLEFTSTKKCLTFTMLREPIDRVISAFYYHGHRTIGWDYCLKNNTHCKHSHEYQNGVTRLFSSNATWTSYDEKPFAAETLDRKQHLLKAQQFLMNVDLVCFLDDIDNCKRNLLAAANLTQRISIQAAESKKENVNKNRENVTAATRHAIKLANELDIELYDWAVQQFQDTASHR